MAGMILIGTLAFFGAFAALWLLWSWLLGKGMGAVVLLFVGRPCREQALLRCRRLRELGLLSGGVLVVDCGLTPPERRVLERKYPEYVFLMPEELPSGSELERYYFG